ncbi:hypothetical protein DFR49_2279 [Hephaestia caeni]|uniref:Uncharacterized protein n=1 Tax=Hephaestia caeni TaxID=645617 RepID=A0A397P6X4_9SPHN|nr:hypothetical protein [Hephaestia caeni]RIA44043.1 hypothetical protein DFR49_2279 [Hephaestia caeni]
MFIVADNPTFKHTVTAMVPIDGGYREETFDVTYNVIVPDEIDEFDLGTVAGSTDFLRRAIHRLDDIAGADKKPIPFSIELRDRLLTLPWARRAISNGYFEAINKARPGN